MNTCKTITNMLKLNKGVDILKFIQTVLWSVVMLFCVNMYAVCKYFDNFALLFIFIPLFIFFNILPSFSKFSNFKLKMLNDGCELCKIMLFTSFVTLALSCYYLWEDYGNLKIQILINTIIVSILEALIFWNGIMRIYFTSVQLGIKRRIFGILVGWIPIVNIVALILIIKTCSKEVKVEFNKFKLNEKRKDERICATKYPIVFVHGVFFRDSKYLNYWGRIPSELEQNGAKVFYGDHQSAQSVSESAAEISRKINAVLVETGAEKVNVIAHSKGGLDCRYAISKLNMDDKIASLTTINTPHRGCIFADYLFTNAPKKLIDEIANKYNTTLIKLGDENPDFIAAVRDLTASACEYFNKEVIDSPKVYYQSTASKQNRAASGKFPLNFSYPIVKHFDGVNDGLVSKESAEWGEKFTYITTKYKRGISHADVIDLTRENLKDFDVREFYVNLVSDLRVKGF